MVPSFDELLVRGVASYSLELFRAVPDIHTLYVPVGWGSGICGALAVRDALQLKTEIVGVVAEAAPTYARSFQGGRAVAHPISATIADGVALRAPDERALELILRGVARILTVTEAEIRYAMRTLFTATHNVAEGAGAVALAAAIQEKGKLSGRRIAVVQSGGNVDRDVFGKVLLENDP
jgi:threonine dehydratase